MPLVDARFLVPCQDVGDRPGDLPGRGRRLAQQRGEYLAGLRDRDRRLFFPRCAGVVRSRTTGPADTASCDDASPPSFAPRSAPAPPPVCPLPGTPRSGGGRHAPAPVSTAAPWGRH